MAVTRGSTSQNLVDAAVGTTDASITHTVDASTTLLLVSVMMRADVTVTGTPSWSGGGGENLTLVDATTSAGSVPGDCAVETWGLVSPTAAAGTVTVTLSADNGLGFVVFAINYLGTNTDSVAAATNFLEEDVMNDSGGDNSTSFVSAGTSGNCLYASGAFKGGDGNPITAPTDFNELLDAASNADIGTGTSGYVCDQLNGAPDACAWTWASSDENAAHYIEIVAGASATSDINYTGTGRGILRGLARGVG